MIRRSRGGLPNFSHASMCLGSSSGATKESRRGQRPRPEQEDDGQNGVLADSQHLANCADVTRNRAGLLSESGGARFYPVSDRCALLRLHRLCGVELPVAQLDAASSLMPRNYAANMIRASPLACSGDFLLRLAVCQGKNLLAKGRRGALAASWYRGRSAPAAALPRFLCPRKQPLITGSKTRVTAVA
jgi:hypothetical protein